MNFKGRFLLVCHPREGGNLDKIIPESSPSGGLQTRKMGVVVGIEIEVLFASLRTVFTRPRPKKTS